MKDELRALTESNSPKYKAQKEKAYQEDYQFFVFMVKHNMRLMAELGFSSCNACSELDVQRLSEDLDKEAFLDGIEVLVTEGPRKSSWHFTW